jgi:hypothetical protein
MNHGRDHQEREQKLAVGETDVAAEDLEEDEEQVASAADIDGAEVAPTARAAERERVRHREERKRGRMAAGVGDNLRDRREPELTRDDLEAAARAADEAVGVHKT